MRNSRILVTVMLLTGFLLIGSGVHGQSETDEERTLSPYFLVKSDDPEVDQLPLKSTSAQVSISGVIADVKVTQVYKNEGHKTLEAIYVFGSRAEEIAEHIRNESRENEDYLILEKLFERT